LCILTTRERAKAEGYDVLAKFVGTAVVGVEPRHMGVAPIYAIPKILAQTGLEKQDIDVYEVRVFSPLYEPEAFSMNGRNRSMKHLHHNLLTALSS
jgi:acetyl-CoA acetyltransferase